MGRYLSHNPGSHTKHYKGQALRHPHTPQGWLKAAPSQLLHLLHAHQVIFKFSPNSNYLLYDSVTHSLITRPKVQTQLLGEVILSLRLCTSLQDSPEGLLEAGGIHHLHSWLVDKDVRGERKENLIHQIFMPQTPEQVFQSALITNNNIFTSELNVSFLSNVSPFITGLALAFHVPFLVPYLHFIPLLRPTVCAGSFLLSQHDPAVRDRTLRAPGAAWMYKTTALLFSPTHLINIRFHWYSIIFHFTHSLLALLSATTQS